MTKSIPETLAELCEVTLDIPEPHRYRVAVLVDHLLDSHPKLMRAVEGVKKYASARENECISYKKEIDYLRYALDETRKDLEDVKNRHSQDGNKEQS